jgi:hypothetical protein
MASKGLTVQRDATELGISMPPQRFTFLLSVGVQVVVLLNAFLCCSYQQGWQQEHGTLLRTHYVMRTSRIWL